MTDRLKSARDMLTRPIERPSSPFRAFWASVMLAVSALGLALMVIMGPTRPAQPAMEAERPAPQKPVASQPVSLGMAFVVTSEAAVSESAADQSSAPPFEITDKP